MADLGRLDDAIYNFRKALSIINNYGSAFVGLGKTLFRKGKHIEGLLTLRKGEGSISFDLVEGVSIL